MIITNNNEPHIYHHHHLNSVRHLSVLLFLYFGGILYGLGVSVTQLFMQRQTNKVEKQKRELDTRQ